MIALLPLLLALAQAPAPADAAPPLPVMGTTANGGRIFRIALGLRFESIVPQLRPGDELVLDRGVHESFTLTDLHGERDRPIVIRGEVGEEPARYPYVKGGTTGIHLVRPRHVLIRDLMAGNGTGSLLTIEGETDPAKPPLDANVVVTNVRLMQTNAEPSQVAIRLRGVSRVDMREISIKGWNDSAAVFDNASQCSLNACMLDVERELPQRTGVRVMQGCSQIALGGLSFAPGVGTAFKLGDCAVAGPDSPPASRVLVRRCCVPEAQVFAWLGAVVDVYVESNTVLDPRRAVLAGTDACAVPRNVLLQGNLVSWMPGTLDRLGDFPPTVPPESVRLMENLWFSPELPGAFEVVGRPFGSELQPQVFTVDPRVEPREAEPRNDAAKSFGWKSATTRVPPPRPKGPKPAPEAPASEGGAPAKPPPA